MGQHGSEMYKLLARVNNPRQVDNLPHIRATQPVYAKIWERCWHRFSPVQAFPYISPLFQSLRRAIAGSILAALRAGRELASIATLPSTMAIPKTNSMSEGCAP